MPAYHRPENIPDLFNSRDYQYGTDERETYCYMGYGYVDVRPIPSTIPHPAVLAMPDEWVAVDSLLHV